MIEHAYKDLYNEDSVRKNILITFEENGEIYNYSFIADENGFVLLEENNYALIKEYSTERITNEVIYSEAMRIKESICSESELKFGCCESNELYFKIANVTGSLKGIWLTVTETLGNDTSTPFKFGKYKVYSDTPSSDRNYREIIAYDSMYDILNADVTSWYNSLSFPITQKNFRDSFFNYLGIFQKSVTLIHDSMSIEKTIATDSISGKEIITSLCELNGVFGHINRDDYFEYISLDSNVTPIEIETRYTKSGEYEDFYTEPISKLQIRQEENDVGIIYGEGNNCYIIEDNFLVYGKSSEELTSICQKLYSKINKIVYRPFKGSIKGNPCYEVGDYILVQTRNTSIKSFILERTLTGIHSLSDDIRAINAFSKEIIKLKGKTNTLERSVEETRSQISNVETGLRSEISQTAGSIRAEVKGISVGAVNLLRRSQTLNYDDYYFS